MTFPAQQPQPTHSQTRSTWRIVIISAAVGGLAVLLFTGLIAPGFFMPSRQPEPDKRPEAEVGGGRYHTNHILQDSPYEAVRQVYQRSSDNSPEFVCGAFSDEAAQQFAADINAANCPEAVRVLYERIDKSGPYWQTWADKQGLPLTSNGVSLKNPPPDITSVEISSCEVTVSPKLGWFKVERVERGQWLITAHRTESC